MEHRVTTLGAARILDVGPDRVRQLEREGQLRAERVGGIRVFERAEVQHLAERRQLERRRAEQRET